MLRNIALAVCLSCIPAFGQTRAPVETTLCQVAKHPSRFHNKIVRLRGSAVSGLEASLLIERTEGNWKEECGRIWLDFGDPERRNESTLKFLTLFGEGLPRPSQAQCDKERQQAILRGMARILYPNTSASASDPNAPAPAPTPCVQHFCLDCRRYSIVATFTGKLRYSKKEPGDRVGFGHMNAFDLQLDVKSVSNLNVTDTLAASGADSQP